MTPNDVRALVETVMQDMPNPELETVERRVGWGVGVIDLRLAIFDALKELEATNE